MASNTKQTKFRRALRLKKAGRKAKAKRNKAILHTVSVFLQSPPGTENSLDVDMIRVSPHVLASRHGN